MKGNRTFKDYERLIKDVKAIKNEDHLLSFWYSLAKDFDDTEQINKIFLLRQPSEFQKRIRLLTVNLSQGNSSI